NLIAAVDKLARLATIMDEDVSELSARDAADVCIGAIQQLSDDVGIPANLVELGKKYGKTVSKADISVMVANAMKDACAGTNPRIATPAQIAAIYEAAMD
ncbi:MAG: hypothetical protein ACRC2T_17950, partial [Thermoguttaceae bacterium]